MKRFTATEKWQKPWYRKLPPRVKCLFQYLCDNCDHAGVIDPDWDLMTFMIGEQVGPKDIELLNGNVVVRQGKLFIPDYIAFQYGNLNPACKPHVPVIESLRKHGIAPSEVNQLALKGLSLGFQSPQEKEKEKEKEEEKDRGSLRGSPEWAEMIYQAYPRKVGKPAAIRKILTAMHSLPPSRLLEVTKAYAAAVAGSDLQFIPHPATWFYQERFNDDPKEWVRNNGKGSQDPTRNPRHDNFGITPDPDRAAKVRAAVDRQQ